VRQSKYRSLQEALAQAFWGFIVSLALQIFLSHKYNMQISLMDNLHITFLFAFVGMVKSYFVRRYMSKGDQKEQIAEVDKSLHSSDTVTL